MSGGIFISYRRDDSAPWAGRLYERLARDFDKDKLFIDVDNIAPGADFAKVLDKRVADADVFLCIIGETWLSALDGDGRRRLDDPKDFVRIEVESALKRDRMLLVPVLVDGARMPSADELPESLRPLALRNAVELTHKRFGADSDSLIASVAKSAQKSKGGIGRLLGRKAAASESAVRGIAPAPAMRESFVIHARDEALSSYLIKSLPGTMLALLLVLLPCQWFRLNDALTVGAAVLASCGFLRVLFGSRVSGSNRLLMDVFIIAALIGILYHAILVEHNFDGICYRVYSFGNSSSLAALGAGLLMWLVAFAREMPRR